MQIIPAIDVLDGTVVRLAQGDFARVTAFADDPLTIARRYAVSGAKRLHLVDLSGAKNGRRTPQFISLVREVAREISVQIGGGIRSLADIRELLDAGADAMVIGTLLFRDPQLVQAAVLLFGVDRIIAALDVRNGEVRIAGWTAGSGIEVMDALQTVQKLGIRSVLMTDISRDGMEGGPALDLYTAVKDRFPDIQFIASGGIRSIQDVQDAEKAGCNGCVVGRALLNNPLLATEFRTAFSSSISSIAPIASSLAIRVIPCLDIAGGRVVKGTAFQNLRDAGDPVELAKRYCDEGADELVFLDISATNDRQNTAVDLAARVATAINIPFTIGGGVRSIEDARRLLDAGADKVAVNSAAVKNPALLSQIASTLGSANTVCAIDARRMGDRWTVLTRGGRDDAGIDAIAWAKQAVDRGAGELLITSFDRDGTGDGFDVELLAAIKNAVAVPVIASGGAGSLQSFVDAAQIGHADAVLAASVFHYGTFTIRDVKTALAAASLPIRL